MVCFGHKWRWREGRELRDINSDCVLLYNIYILIFISTYVYFEIFVLFLSRPVNTTIKYFFVSYSSTYVILFFFANSSIPRLENHRATQQSPPNYYNSHPLTSTETLRHYTHHIPCYNSTPHHHNPTLLSTVDSNTTRQPRLPTIDTKHKIRLYSHQCTCNTKYCTRVPHTLHFSQKSNTSTQHNHEYIPPTLNNSFPTPIKYRPLFLALIAP